MIHDCLIRYHLKKKSGSERPCYRKNQAVCPQYRCRCKEAAQGGGRQVLAFRAQSSSLFCAATSPFRISNDSRSSIVAKFRAGFISHSGLKIEREISHTFEIRNFPQRNIPVAKFTPPLYPTQLAQVLLITSDLVEAGGKSAQELCKIGTLFLSKATDAQVSRGRGPAVGQTAHPAGFGAAALSAPAARMCSGGPSPGPRRTPPAAARPAATAWTGATAG